MDQKNSGALRRPLYAAALALVALGAPLPGAVGLLSEAQARAPRGPQQIAGTWEAIWRNSRGAPRKGLIVIEQRGAQLSARIESHGNVTATGSIEGSTFTLHGSRMGVPFTVTGRVQSKKMTGMLSALFVERPFTATRRKGK
jgi:hypothetical protein